MPKHSTRDLRCLFQPPRAHVRWYRSWLSTRLSVPASVWPSACLWQHFCVSFPHPSLTCLAVVVVSHRQSLLPMSLSLLQARHRPYWNLPVAELDTPELVSALVQVKTLLLLLLRARSRTCFASCAVNELQSSCPHALGILVSCFSSSPYPLSQQLSPSVFPLLGGDGSSSAHDNVLGSLHRSLLEDFERVLPARAGLTRVSAPRSCPSPSACSLPPS